jgi:hypothetical protein
MVLQAAEPSSQGAPMPTTGEITIRMWDVRLVVRKERGKNGGAKKTKLGTTPKNKIKTEEEKREGHA